MLPQRIYIHASLSRSEINEEVIESVKKNLTSKQRMELKGKTLGNLCSFGAIIGEATLTTCVTKYKSPWFIGPYGLVFTDPVLYLTPIHCKGSLGFFEPGPDFAEWQIAKPLGLIKGV
jgi:hypothetical protein